MNAIAKPDSFLLFKITLGSFLFFHSVTLSPRSSPTLLCVRSGLMILALFWTWGPFAFRISSIAIFLLWAVEFSLAPNLMSSETPLVGWLLLACALLPADGKPDRGLWWISWIEICALYFNSGVSKILDPAWLSGDTIRLVMSSGLNRFPFSSSLLTLPLVALAISYGLIAIQLAAPLALLGSRLRQIIWWLHVAFHLITLLILKVDQVSWAFLAFHFFIYGPKPVYSPGKAKSFQTV